MRNRRAVLAIALAMLPFGLPADAQTPPNRDEVAVYAGLHEAAAKGNANARIALDMFANQIRRFFGQFLVRMNGADVLIFTAGIGENNPDLRAAICANLGELGIALDPARNEALRGAEGEISAAGSRAKVLVIPANEELVVARETVRCLQARR